MKTFKLTILIALMLAFFTSCVIDEDPIYYEDDTMSLNELLQSKDVWYIDYNATQGNDDTRFLSLAFTLSFKNGNVFANNNLVDIGLIGNGLGDQIGYYNTNGTILEIDHDLDGAIDLEVIQTSNNRIKLRDLDRNVTYSLIGYYKDQFDYDQVFYDNIEYFLQEYTAWKKTGTYNGVENDFDNENFLAFTPNNVSEFASSQDTESTRIEDLLWDFTGTYEVANIQGERKKKNLTLYYDSYGNETFEITVLNDGKIALYHYDSDTTYEFEGSDQIIFKRLSQKKEKKRFKTNRKTVTKRQKITKVSNRK